MWNPIQDWIRFFMSISKMISITPQAYACIYIYIYKCIYDYICKCSYIDEREILDTRMVQQLSSYINGLNVLNSNSICVPLPSTTLWKGINPSLLFSAMGSLDLMKQLLYEEEKIWIENQRIVVRENLWQTVTPFFTTINKSSTLVVVM